MVRIGKRQEKEVKGREAGVPRRKLPPLKAYLEPPSNIQYRVRSRAGQVLKTHKVVFRKGKSYFKTFFTGKDAEEIAKRIKAWGEDFGKVEENYCVFSGSYKDAVRLLKEKIESLIQISEEILGDTPDVPLDHHMCLLADYVKLAEFLVGEIRRTFDLVDEIYQYLELSD